MKDLRLIRKYPNRRMYDTAECRYITLADIRKLVVDKVDFIVMEKSSQQDITDRVLLQVMSEQEHSGVPVLGREFLLQTIRLYGSPLQGLVGECLRQSVSSLVSRSQDMPLPVNVSARSPRAEGGEIVAVVQ
jgi:polyhydroxyalkanoate synthesis repressor PhaR